MESLRWRFEKSHLEDSKTRRHEEQGIAQVAREFLESLGIDKKEIAHIREWSRTA